MTRTLVLGLDLGTGGARALVVAAEGGAVLGKGSAPCASRRSEDGRHEQEPAEWWSAARAAIVAALREAGEVGGLRAIAVDGTSGSVLGLDARGAPTTAGLMYDDARGAALRGELEARTGAALAGVPGLLRLAWIERELPEAFARTARFAHQADYVAAQLTGAPPVSDWSNALKSGYDAERGVWSPWLEALPDLRARLPEVVAPGAPLGVVAPEVALELGLPPGVEVVAGCSDGTAGFLASGASRLGEDNTTLGTTLVFKRVADRAVSGRGLYCHVLPGGVRLPGAASNVGGGWVREQFAGADLAVLDAAAERALPSPHLAYPSNGGGERFPFQTAEPVEFWDAPVGDAAARYASGLQGTAFVERLAYAALDAATGPSEGAVYATGGGAASDVWLQLRADVTRRSFRRPACAESAFGAALLAAGHACYEDLWAACRALVHIEREFAVDENRAEAFEPHYERFVARLAERGFVALGS